MKPFIYNHWQIYVIKIVTNYASIIIQMSFNSFNRRKITRVFCYTLFSFAVMAFNDLECFTANRRLVTQQIECVLLHYLCSNYTFSLACKLKKTLTVGNRFLSILLTFCHKKI